MNYSIKILPEANEDIEKAKQWIANQPTMEVNTFLEHLLETVEYFANNPKLFFKRYKQIREAQISLFPFKVYYLIDETYQQIIIMAVIKIELEPIKTEL